MLADNGQGIEETLKKGMIHLSVLGCSANPELGCCVGGGVDHELCAGFVICGLSLNAHDIGPMPKLRHPA